MSVLSVDNNVRLHEVVEAACVDGRVAGWYEFAVSLVKPNLQEVLRFLLQIVCLQVVDNRNVINVAAILGYEFVARALVFVFKLLHQ